MTPPTQWYINREVEEMDEAYYYIFHNDEFFAKCPSKEIADMVVAACSRETPAPAAPYPISNIEFAKGLAECLGNEPEEHEECNICPLRGKCIDLNLMVDATTIRNQTLDAIIKFRKENSKEMKIHDMWVAEAQYLESLRIPAPSETETGV